MNVNKKLDRFKQWAGERMGGEVKTCLTDEFKTLETDTELRHDGAGKLHKAMVNYTKSISKRAEAEHREKQLPIAQLGSVMVQHGNEFEHDSQYGQYLVSFGRTQDRLARSQEAYIAAATNTWLESLERSLGQAKEYQSARKKLDSRRLAYDTSLAKMQKAKKEDFRVEEELRSQKLKFEEAEEDVYRKMLEAKDSENDTTADLTAFLDAQLAYHERCREALFQLKEEWSVGHSQTRQRLGMRSRSNTARSLVSTHSSIDERPALEVRTGTRTIRTPPKYLDSPVEHNGRPAFTRSTTFDSSPRSRRDLSPVNPEALTRVTSDSRMVENARSDLRNTTRLDTNVLVDRSSIYPNGIDHMTERSYSPADSHGSGSNTPLTMKRRAPPPPPPSRATKPAPPPPPAKRSLVA